MWFVVAVVTGDFTCFLPRRGGVHVMVSRHEGSNPPPAGISEGWIRHFLRMEHAVDRGGCAKHVYLSLEAWRMNRPCTIAGPVGWTATTREGVMKTALSDPSFHLAEEGKHQLQ